MELPKNITQIGQADNHCKIYVEDYVISYLKQMNQVAEDKEMAVALYGVRKEENEVSYLFLYGACKLTFLQKDTKHLSQAQLQEIEKYRTKYFGNYVFLGYRLLNGEMIEGIHVCEQGICRYISGYAQFYEKNESMLAYMLDVREETQPETVEQEKYDAVKKRQEERRIQHEEGKHAKTVQTGGSSDSDSSSNSHSSSNSNSSGGVRGMRVAVVATFALLCVIGLSSLNGGGKLSELQAMAGQAIANVMKQQLPNKEDGKEGVNTLIAEDKLAQAILEENETLPSENGTAKVENASEEVAQVSSPGITPEQAQNPVGSELENIDTKPDANTKQVITPEGTTANTEQAVIPEGTTANAEQAVMPEGTTANAEQAVMPEGTTANAEQAVMPDGTTVNAEQAVMPEGTTANAEQAVMPEGTTANTEQAATPEETSVNTVIPDPQPVSYTIREGDTLIGISVRNYGNDERVEEICLLNQIENPDDIKVGEKILLP